MITIIDYGMGNLRSVSKAIEHLGGRCQIVSRGNSLKKPQKLILPGVGAFGDAMKELKQRGFIEAIHHLVRSGTKLLGVCLGLQLFFESSEEAPGVKGLGLFSGKVIRFRSSGVKIPHMGWNSITRPRTHPLMKGIPPQAFFYFVHSYYAKPKDSKIILASCRYGRESFPAIVGNDRIAAAQFHPEKSQDEGLKLLSNFIRW